MLTPRTARRTLAASLALAALAFGSACTPADPRVAKAQTVEPSPTGPTEVGPAAVPPSRPDLAHGVQHVAVDNTGPELEVTVTHPRGDWRGRVTLTLDVVADERPELVAAVGHGVAADPTFTRPSGGEWACGARTLTSTGTTTRLTFARECLTTGAPKLQATIDVVPQQGERVTHATAAVEQQDRPNVIMLVADDMRADELQWMPKTRQWLGSAGTTWTNALAPYPLCCPARASYFSGQYTHNHGVYTHKPPYGFPVFDDRSTLATWLDDAGYHTTLLGKYLNGYGNRTPPRKSSGVSVNYYPPGWDDWRASLEGGLPDGHPQNGSSYRYFDTTLSLNRGRGLVALQGEYQTTAYGRITAQQVRENAAAADPFFSYVAFTAPHHGAPNEKDDPRPVRRVDGERYKFVTPAVPRRLRGRFDDRIKAAPGSDWRDPDLSDRPPGFDAVPLNGQERAALVEVTRQRAESIAAVDDAIDRVMQSLRRSGELEDTYVLFTSDNGYFLGEQGMRQGKINPYGPALRVPLLIRGPGVPQGVVRNAPFTSVDFAPTILQMAGAQIPGSVDGVGLLEVAKHGGEGWNRPVLVNSGPGRLTDEGGEPVGTPHSDAKRYIIGVRTPAFHYTRRTNGFEELFDLRRDPRETDNLLDPATGAVPRAYRDALRALRAELDTLKDCAGSECHVELPQILR